MGISKFRGYFIWFLRSANLVLSEKRNCVIFSSAINKRTKNYPEYVIVKCFLLVSYNTANIIRTIISCMVGQDSSWVNLPKSSSPKYLHDLLMCFSLTHMLSEGSEIHVWGHASHNFLLRCYGWEAIDCWSLRTSCMHLCVRVLSFFFLDDKQTHMPIPCMDSEVLLFVWHQHPHGWFWIYIMSM